VAFAGASSLRIGPDFQQVVDLLVEKGDWGKPMPAAAKGPRRRRPREL